MAGVVGRVSGDSLVGPRTGPRPLFPSRWGGTTPLPRILCYRVAVRRWAKLRVRRTAVRWGDSSAPSGCRGR